MTLTKVALDPYDYGFQEDPYPVYAWLREHEPLHHNPALDLWALSRHEDIAEALRTEGTFSNSYGVAIEASAWGPDAHRVMSILGMDPPRQKRLRSLVSRGFTPRRVQDLLPRIQALTDRYLGECLERGSFDWITDFAGKLPMDVISEMMGVPEEDRDEVRRQADVVVHREDGVYDVPPAAMDSSLWLVGYYQAMVDQRRRQPTDDLTSALLEAEVDGDRLSDEDVIAFLFLMVVAGNETTTKLLGHAVFHLTRHPDQAATVFGDGDAELVAPVDRGDAALRHLQPAARPLPAPGRRAARPGRAGRRQAAALPRLGQPRRAGLRPAGRVRRAPRQGRARADPVLRRRPALLPRRQPGPAGGPDRAHRPGARAYAASRSTTTAACACTRSTSAASPRSR